MSLKRIIRRDEVTQMVGLSRSTIYRLVQARAFPRPFKLGAQAVGWDLADVEAWIECQKGGANE
jgi:prophage regulatory protein